MTERNETGLVTDDDWVAQLKQLREADETKQRAQELRRKQLQGQTGPTADFDESEQSPCLAAAGTKSVVGRGGGHQGL